MLNWAAWSFGLLCFVILPSGVGAFECNDLKRFRCKNGKGTANGCTWKKDGFRKYRHFPTKKKLFGICLNSGQSESDEVFGTPADRCDCGTKCMRKCKSKRGYKKKCYWAGPKRGGTCLPNRHFAPAGGCSSAYQINDTSLKTAVSDWNGNEAAATITYGDISCWNTSLVTIMDGQAFWNEGTYTFNADLSKWDTSKVTTMEETFKSTKAFNADLSKWDTSKVTSMESMFKNAAKFGADIRGWDVSEVMAMSSMFENAVYFNQDLSKWDVSKVDSSDMSNMFKGATAFTCSNNLPDGMNASETFCSN